jgi:DivIVA domain-containing protein
MDLTSQVLHDVEFREAKRGYNTQDVDEFLERLAVAVDRQEAQLREARQRVAAAEGRIAEAERRAEDVERRGGGPGGSEADETLKRTLVLAQRTADAAIREAEEQAARMLAAAEDEAQRLVTDAHEASAQAYADAEDEARRAQHEARSRVLAELQELEAGRELLRSDVDMLEQHIGEQRERLRLTIRDLTALVEDPAALREVYVPSVAEITIPEPEPAPQPRRLVAAPVPDEELDDEDWETPASGADDFQPVPTPAPRPRAARDDRYADRPLLADARQVEPEAPDPEDDEDDEDAYLTELRKAMTDDAPLGPRDEPEDHLGGGPATGRSRFGRRR